MKRLSRFTPTPTATTSAIRSFSWSKHRSNDFKGASSAAALLPFAENEIRLPTALLRARVRSWWSGFRRRHCKAHPSSRKMWTCGSRSWADATPHSRPRRFDFVDHLLLNDKPKRHQQRSEKGVVEAFAPRGWDVFKIGGSMFFETRSKKMPEHQAATEPSRNTQTKLLDLSL